MKKDDDDFWGERMCKPSAGMDVLFNRKKLEKQKAIQQLEEKNGLKIFVTDTQGHRIATGHDVAGGVGLDSSTTVAIDFDTLPAAQVVATYACNTIKPDMFGYEIKRQVDLIGAEVVAIENNKFDSAIQVAKQEQVPLYMTEGKIISINQPKPKNYGWNTNSLTKSKMLFALAKAIENDMLYLNDEALIQELKSYTRNDLIDNEKDPRLTTRHFDLLIACAIAWQMKDEFNKSFIEVI